MLFISMSGCGQVVPLHSVFCAAYGCEVGCFEGFFWGGVLLKLDLQESNLLTSKLWF